MSTGTLDLDAYFQRIGYQGERAATLPVLQALHQAHPGNIPFENLSSLAGAPVLIDIDSVQRKLVAERRGGYCYEQNTLLMAVLQALGFTVHGLAARVCWRTPAELRPLPRTHMLLQVMVGEEAWLADVGFGGLTLTAPLRFEPELVQTTSHEPFRIRQLNEREYLVEAQLGGVWHELYQFDTQPQVAVDYEPINWFTSSHRSSRFVNHLMAAFPAADGRHALFDNRYSRHYLKGPSETRLITDTDELIELLRTTFTINVPADEALQQRLAALVERPDETPR